MIKLVRILNLTNFFMYILKQFNNLFLNTVCLSLNPESSSWVYEDNSNKESPQIDNSNKETNDVLSQIELLQIELDQLDATKKYVWTAWSYLDKKLSPEDYSDPEAKQTIDLLETYKKQFKEAIEIWKSVEQELANLKQELHKIENKFEFSNNIDYDTESWEIVKNKVSMDELKSITNHEFLSLNKNERLQYVTKNHIDSENISNWSIDNVEFNFTFDWVFNNELYMLTTAWQVLPQEVWEVKSDWVIYTREWLNWEFFNWNERLKIHDWTNIEVTNLRTKEDIDKMNDLNTSDIKELSKFVDSDIAIEWVSRWIKDKDILINLSSKLENLWDYERKLKSEELFTILSRMKWVYWFDYDSKPFKDIVLNNDIENFSKWYYDSLENHESWYEKYKDLVNEVASKYWIEPSKLKQLIDHENRKWNPNSKAPWSSAYGLWQMINDTWLIYWKWFDRSDPKGQLEATCKYLNSIMTRKNCSIELAMAYYNTWEWVHGIWNDKAIDYANKNPAISKLIEWSITPDSYFKAAIAYYNDTTFKQASTLV